jgi:hypothetical protein
VFFREADAARFAAWLPYYGSFAKVATDAEKMRPTDSRPHSRGTKYPGDASHAALEAKRAQGMPDAGRTHGPPATKKAGGSHHRQGRNNRHSLRDSFNRL